jgi:hypothetical protein
MAFELQQVVPWGRTMDEYIRMFSLKEDDLNKQIVGFGDGPASFNAEMTKHNRNVVSIDPIYQFTRTEIAERIEETCSVVIDQTSKNKELFIWDEIPDVFSLEQIRMKAMNDFLADFEIGKKESRYLTHVLPDRTNFEDSQFELGLSSHFLFLYPQLGIDFHIMALKEMLRICKEVRIFPLQNLNAEVSEILDKVIAFFKASYHIDIQKVNYEFQKGSDKMMVLKNKQQFV